MRVTAEAKIETRERIVKAATALFTSGGYDSTTTRAIAVAAGIATGTLFNYFASKEAIVAALISDAFATARQEVRSRRRADDSLEEELFSLIWTDLSSLRPFRRFLPSAAETILSPLRRSSPDRAGDSIRVDHLRSVEEIIVRHGVSGPLSALTLQLYWTLYVGVFACWTTDDSPHQEDTLALLDQSLKLFIASLPRRGDRSHDHQTQ